jgi:glutamate synthase domain-containing protein 1
MAASAVVAPTGAPVKWAKYRGPPEGGKGAICGIVGVFYKGAEAGPVGPTLVEMCQELYRRGTDSVGYAIYREPRHDSFLVRVDLDSRSAADAGPAAVRAAAGELVTVQESQTVDHNVRLVVDSDADGQLADRIEDRVEGARVFSVGRSMEIIKDLGSAYEMEKTYQVARYEGTHGIGHTRMATESRVDIAHSHPFWARPFPDIAVVHNGTITNYHKLRRQLALKGHHFSTENDSEVIAVYIADRLENGDSMEEALTASVRDLDGTFAYLISTREGIGLARDQFAMKPLLYAEDDELVVLASEECAIRRVLRDPNLVPRELQAKEVRWWLR